MPLNLNTDYEDDDNGSGSDIFFGVSNALMALSNARLFLEKGAMFLDSSNVSGVNTTKMFTSFQNFTQGFAKTSIPLANEPGGGDLPASTSTTGTIAIGGSATGTRESGTDEDWFSIDLQQGTTYTFFMLRSGDNPHSDPFLNLYNSSGTLITSNDDIEINGEPGGENRNSFITYTATETGTFYLGADGWSTTTGDYTVYAEVGADRPDFTLQESAFFLTSQFDNKAIWGKTALTYDISGLSAGAQALALAALTEWSDVSGLSFTLATGTADITFNENRSDSGNATAFASSSSSNGTVTSATITISDNWTNNADGSPNYDINSYRYQTYLHEIGHALGLGHGGPYNGQNVDAAGVSYHVYNQDAWNYTVMSYRDQADAGTGTARLVLGPQVVDIIAIQDLYGANTQTRTGDSVYGFNSTETGVLDFETTFFNQGIRPPSLSIYDAGGVDTLDFSGYSANQTISLVEGSFSSIGDNTNTSDTTDALVNLITVAVGTVIENAIGGSGNDTFIGNGADNVFTGNGGNDTYSGGAGSDTVILSIDQNSYTITADETNGQMNLTISGGPDGTDQIDASTIEFIGFSNGGQLVSTSSFLTPPPPPPSQFTEGDDWVTGTEGNDVFDGLGGNDFIDGLGGNDVLIGGGDNDTLNGGTGNDGLVGGIGDDILNGGDGNDMLDGGAGDDVISGELGDDQLMGGSGNDTLIGGLGNDMLDGGDGNDTVVFGETDRVIVRLNTQTVNTGDTISELENVTTNAGNDALIGSNVANILSAAGGDDYLDGQGGDDILIGGTGNDRLFGRDGNDTLFGGSGNDTLDGGSGNDTVVFDEFNRVVVRLNTQTVETGDTIAGFENATTGVGNDALIGSNGANILTAGAGDDYLDGQGGDDTLIGGTGNDRLFGQDGNDTLMGGAGNDTLDGGAGNDTVVFGETSRVVVRLNSQTVSTGDTIAGFENATTDAGNDALIGSAVANILTAGAGDDYLDGQDGGDTLNGGAGNDRLFGQNGNDTLAGGSGNDTLDGGYGNDTLDGGHGNDTVVFDEAGRVVVRLNTQTVDTGDTIANFENATTGAGNDALIGSAVANILTAGAGDDYLDGQAGDDVLNGGTGNDRLFGRDGNDTLAGGSGNDTLDGGDGNDTVVFDEAGRVVVRLNTQTVDTGDTIAGFENATTGAGNDALIGSAVANILTAGAGDDYLDGQAGDDVLNSGAGNDRLFGRDGNDTLAGGEGNDTLDGGDGNDTVVFDEAGRVVVRLNTQTVTSGDTISGFENATTGAGNDALIGSSVANMLSGRAGDDYLDGQGGNDVLVGGTGNDRSLGGAGDDTFVFDTVSGGSDQILDFTQGDDQLAFGNQNSAFDTFSEVMAVGSQDGADAVFDFGCGNVLRLAGTDLSALNIDDMLFAATGSMASAKPDGEDLSGLSAFYNGVDTVNHSQLANETLLSDFDDFAVDDQGQLALPYEAAPLMTYRGQDGMLNIFDPEIMQQPDDFTGFEIA